VNRPSANRRDASRIAIIATQSAAVAIGSAGAAVRVALVNGWSSAFAPPTG
jgi:hypothetical protein